MPDLSPAAQAVLDAFAADNYGVWLEGDPDRIAAALSTAADQVVPEDCLEHFPNDSAWQGGFTDANERIRAEILAIAAELKAQ